MKKRILIKLSGEAFKGEKEFGYDRNFINNLAQEIKKLHDTNLEILFVIGGGNIFRGNKLHNDFQINKVESHNCGMLATIINGIVLKSILLNHKISSCVLSSKEITGICDGFNIELVNQQLQDNKIVILVGGTGNSFFTTDTAAVLRAVETKCDYMVKATLATGVYNKDPLQHSDAKKIQYLSYDTAITKKIQIMDATAFTLARENDLIIKVFSIKNGTGLFDIIHDQGIFSTISNKYN